ncbi:MAG: ATP-binding cassette domain-containing protein [Desulfobacterales bacterium]
MILTNIQNISLGYGGSLLLKDVDLQIRQGERICLIGRNGAGKSTLIRILTGTVQPDTGKITVRDGVKMTCLDQEVPGENEGTVFDVIAGGYGKAAAILSEFHHTIRLLAGNEEQALLQKLEWLQQKIDEADGWKMELKVNQVITRLQLEPEALFNELSAGLKRRVLLAKALVPDPDLLLLDEPTNHLDIHAIEWLEDFLQRFKGTVLFVTHDRMFLQKLATRIVELDRGRLFNWKCNYEKYLTRKEELISAEEREIAIFDKKLAAEEKWIRQGIKARRSRNEGRVTALEKMREVRRIRQSRMGSANMEIQEFEKSGKLVIEAKALTYTWEERVVLCDFSTTILRGDKIGIIGPNGSGKTTLLKILLGELAPCMGTVRLGTRFHVAYFDQLRAKLNENKTVQENICNGSDMITFNDKPRHIISFLQDFLFTPERARSPVRTLSGGERNRLLLARLFSRPSNVLVFDEPTNDLDTETLELLEELLLEYSGTILLISHDRAFLNNVVTSTFVFEGEGKVNEYVGGYDDWVRQKMPDPVILKKRPASHHVAIHRTRKNQKLSYNEQGELKNLPGIIESLEDKQKKLFDKMSDPAFYQTGGKKISSIKRELESIGKEIEEAYSRWEFLESLISNTGHGNG